MGGVVAQLLVPVRRHIEINLLDRHTVVEDLPDFVSQALLRNQLVPGPILSLSAWAVIINCSAYFGLRSNQMSGLGLRLAVPGESFGGHIAERSGERRKNEAVRTVLSVNVDAG
jgi:hypothetical protein